MRGRAPRLRARRSYDEVQDSGDDNYHACVLPTSQEFRCLYAPRLGF